MSESYDLYITSSGPYRLAFMASQIDMVLPCPDFPADEAWRDGVLGTHEGVQVIHPAWLWGNEGLPRHPRQLLVVRTGTCALAVDTCRMQHAAVEPLPAALAANCMLFGLIMGAEDITPVYDLACVPLA
jgi:hypothetical protein